MGVLLEVIVSSLDDARAAAAGGADRFELCSGLALGGLTPSLGLLQLLKEEISTPTVFMLRPREGGMCYARGELSSIDRDAELALEAGAEGLVVGFLTPDGEVDVPQCRDFLRRCSRVAAGRQWVFHRAFDVLRDPDVGLEQLIDLGFTRILTSGRAARAFDGLREIRRMVELADGRIEILPGGGIRLDHLAQVVRETGVNQVHMSITDRSSDSSATHNPVIRFGANLPETESDFRVASTGGVRQAKAMLAGL